MKMIKWCVLLMLLPFVSGAAGTNIGGGQIWPEFTAINVDSLWVWTYLDLSTKSPTIVWPSTLTFTDIDADSVDTEHLVVNTTAALGAAVTSDSGGTAAFSTNLFTIGALTAGDQDIVLRFSESDANHDLMWEDGASRFVFSANLRAEGSISANGQVSGTGLQVTNIIQSTGAILTIDPETTGAGTLQLGNSEADTTRVQAGDIFDVDGKFTTAEIVTDSAATVTLASNLITIGAGTAGDADIEVYADSGGTAFKWFHWDYAQDRTKFAAAVYFTGISSFAGSAEFTQGTNEIDWDNVGGGTGYLGGNDATADTTDIRANDVLRVSGVALLEGSTEVTALEFDTFFGTKATYDSTATLGALVYMAILDQAASQDTLNLPAAASHTDRMIIIKCVNANGSVVDANSTELIDDSQTQALAQWDALQLFCDGTRWLIF